MATYTAAYADVRINDAARFRTQGGWIGTQFQTMGWTKTADTGQIDWTTVLAPGAANTIMGYEIRSNGTLYMKVSYGSGYAAYSKSLWFQFGSGSDGAGALTGPYAAQVQLSTAIGYSGASARAGDDYMSGDSTRFSVALTDDTSAVYGGSCALEPSLDLNGDADGFGYYFTKVGYNYTGTTRLYAHQSWVESSSLSTLYLPRVVGSAGVYIPVSPIMAPHPINGVSVLRDVVMVPTSLVAHQATLTVGGITYLSGFGNTTNSGIWGMTPAFVCSFMTRYD